MPFVVFKISIALLICMLLITFKAYLDLRRTMIWYKKQYDLQPRLYRIKTELTWQQRFVNAILTIKSII
jgi:hypothetical protein